MHVCTLQNLAMYREVFPHLLICLLLSEQHLVIPEGSFLVPEIGILFGDAVGPPLFEAPGCHLAVAMSSVTLLYVADANNTIQESI